MARATAWRDIRSLSAAARLERGGPSASINRCNHRRPLEAHCRHLRSRKQAGKDITYLPWPFAIQYLDHYAPGWSFEIRNVMATAERFVVTARRTIPCLEGAVWREATGTEDEELKGWGDPLSNAEAMALKRAAAKFGLGLYLYQK